MATQKQIEDYVKKFTPLVLKKSNETGIPFAFAISHIAMESAYGIAAPGFNFMGIKGNKDNGQLLWTWEAYVDKNKFAQYTIRDESTLKFKNGKWYMKVKTYFRKFTSLDAALTYYFDLLLNSRYKPALDKYKNENLSVWQYGYEIMKRGYATTNPQVYSDNIKKAFYTYIKPVLDSNKDLNPTNIAFPFILVLGLLIFYFVK
jgi:flagellum-specific peptidoglycan hydrolase FlgJ